ncbi:hypothetical protein [Xanthomonas fragariae]|uniref:hypothetical protein n=1 Tax=Xanthomonas fragariae TaxID=48664 RepID=UPI00131F0BC3|nr:hypothetical protein [Xanthomonas fragariae]MDM7587929.1 hypothetical protein [Xanthomonas fragariae]
MILQNTQRHGGKIAPAHGGQGGYAFSSMDRGRRMSRAVIQIAKDPPVRSREKSEANGLGVAGLANPFPIAQKSCCFAALADEAFRTADGTHDGTQKWAT